MYAFLSRKEFRVLNTAILTVGSVTYAIKARKLLLRSGIRSKLVKVNENKSARGCSHGIEIDGSDFYSVVAVLRESGIPYSVYSGG